MSSSIFEIKIIKEADGSDVDLSKMSLQASKSLLVILDAFVKMADAEDSADITVGVKSGSACVQIGGPVEELDSVKTKILGVINKKHNGAAYLEGLRSIQKVIQANGLTYESSFQFEGAKIDLVAQLKGAKTFRLPRTVHVDSYYDIKFIDGKLIEVGGVRPNIHIEFNGIKQKIGCTEQQAQRVNSFLYARIRLSVWEGIGRDGKPYYIFCDHYINDELFKEFQFEISAIMKGEGTEPLLRIHRKFKDLITEGRGGEARKFIRFFTHSLVDKHKMRSMLVATKAFRENKDFSDLIETTVKNLERKTGKRII